MPSGPVLLNTLVERTDEIYPENLKNYKQLKVIGDITCDINGSIPTTIKSTTIIPPISRSLNCLAISETATKLTSSAVSS